MNQKVNIPTPKIGDKFKINADTRTYIIDFVYCEVVKVDEKNKKCTVKPIGKSLGRFYELEVTFSTYQKALGYES